MNDAFHPLINIPRPTFVSVDDAFAAASQLSEKCGFKIDIKSKNKSSLSKYVSCLGNPHEGKLNCRWNCSLKGCPIYPLEEREKDKYIWYFEYTFKRRGHNHGPILDETNLHKSSPKKKRKLMDGGEGKEKEMDKDHSITAITNNDHGEGGAPSRGQSCSKPVFKFLEESNSIFDQNKLGKVILPESTVKNFFIEKIERLKLECLTRKSTQNLKTLLRIGLALDSLSDEET